MTVAPSPPYTIDTLRQILADLRDPVGGCPWDQEQSFASIVPYTIEEAYEVADAIARGDMDDLRSELGDLLLQTVYHSQIAAESNLFGFDDVVKAVCAKMIARHPHVYGPHAHKHAGKRDASEQRGAWEEAKASERAAVGARGALTGVALGLPALTRAEKLQKRAARSGFDWPDAAGPRAKIDEELEECAAATSTPALHDEIGDLLFSVVNWARHLDIDPEGALRDANRRFENRFAAMEAASDRPLSSLSLEELERLWEGAKRAISAQAGPAAG